MFRREQQLKQSLHQLRETHEKMKTIMKVVPAGLFQASADGQCLFVNPTWSHFTGYSSEEGVGHGWKRGLRPEDVSRIEEEWRQGAELLAPIQLVYQYKARGEWKWIHTKAVPHFNENGEFVCYYGASIDLTAQKMTENELRESRNLLSAILENLPVALVCKDVQNNFAYTFANRKAQSIVGRPEGEIVAKSDFDIFPPEIAEQIRAEDHLACQAGRATENPEKLIKLPNGQMTYVSSKKIPLRDESGEIRMLLGIVEDRTAQREYERLIEEQRMKLVHSEKMSALGEMAGGIAHEINNPLTVIELNATQLRSVLNRGVKDVEVLEKYTNRISSTVQRIAKIVRGLKTFARDGENDPYESVSVEVLIKEAFEFCQSRYQQHGVEFRIGPMPTDSLVDVRVVQLSQVFLNLFNNAFDAVHLKPNSWVQVDVRDLGADLEISVLDSGSGIAPEVANKIMNPFFTTKEVGKGTGLGLSVSLAIVKGHGGTLTLDSQNPNTCFVLRIPKIQNSLAEDKAAA